MAYLSPQTRFLSRLSNFKAELTLTLYCKDHLDESFLVTSFRICSMSCLKGKFEIS